MNIFAYSMSFDGQYFLLRISRLRCVSYACFICEENSRCWAELSRVLLWAFACGALPRITFCSERIMKGWLVVRLSIGAPPPRRVWSSWSL